MVDVSKSASRMCLTNLSQHVALDPCLLRPSATHAARMTLSVESRLITMASDAPADDPGTASSVDAEASATG